MTSGTISINTGEVKAMNGDIPLTQFANKTQFHFCCQASSNVEAVDFSVSSPFALLQVQILLGIK
jgi:hypothetical protein